MVYNRIGHVLEYYLVRICLVRIVSTLKIT